MAWLELENHTTLANQHSAYLWTIPAQKLVCKLRKMKQAFSYKPLGKITSNLAVLYSHKRAQCEEETSKAKYLVDALDNELIIVK